MENQLDLKLLLEHMVEGVVIRDRNLRMIHFNSAAPKMFGMTPEEFQTMMPSLKTWNVIREDGSPFPFEEQSGPLAMKTGKTIRGLVMGVKTDEKVVWVSTNSTPIFDAEKKPFQVITTLNDITEQKELLSTVQKSEERFRVLFDNAPVGIAEHDLQGNFTTTNRSFSEMMGYSRQELRKMSILDLTHPDDIELTKNVMRRFSDPGFSANHLQKRYFTKTGEVVWGEVTARTLEFPSGAKRIFSVIKNITEQKKLEENIEFQKAKLVQSSKMSALGEMAAGMAHEINNPLAIIAAYTGVLKTQLTKDSLVDLDNIREKLTQIEKTVERVAKIVRGLKQFSRNADQDPKVRVPVKQIIDDTMVFCLERLKSKSIDVRISIPDGLECLARPTQITQIILNLLNNSFDSIQGTSSPWIELNATEDQHSVKITVCDSGVKIPETVQQKMMQPFYTTKDIGKGTGLGLSISQGLIESHGGKLSYDSSKPHNCFIIEIPKL